MKILIVDDFEMIRIIMHKTLTNLGYEDIHQSCDGREALNSLQQAAEKNEPYDLVFADWNMPEMSGLELLQECKKNERLKSTPIIMVTAESDRAFVLEALMSGASDYVIKPFSPDAIASKMNAVLAKTKNNKAG